MNINGLRWFLAFGVALSLALSAAPGLADSVIQAPVNDLAGVIEPRDEAAIEEALRAMRKDTGVQMAVLTINTTAGRPIEDYALEVAEAWGGGSAERDDGVLFVLAIYDRRMRLEVGYGIEGVITDGEALTIIDGIKDHLRAENYGAGVLQVVEGVRGEVDGLEAGKSIPLYYKAVPFVTLGLGGWLFYLLGLGAVLLGQERWERAMKVRQKNKRLAPGFITVFLGVVPVALFMLVWPVAGMPGAVDRAGNFVAGLAMGGLIEVRANGSKFRLVLSLIFAVCWAAVLFFLVWRGELAEDLSTYIGLAFTSVAVNSFVGMMFNLESSGSGGGGGSSYSSSSSSYSSSSYSSSSSSSSSWDGGGGSFGGGGASSSW